MSEFSLNPQGKRRLRNASRSAIENYFITLPERQRNSQWLQLGNRYRLSCVERYKKDTIATPPTVDHRHLARYVSASAPTHVIDGWSFLGRAVDSTLRGDAYSAVHFAYYAELRAAMGLLAAEGIGIFGNRHTIVDVNGMTDRFPQKAGTHAAIWPILRYWTSLSRAAVLLEEVVSPDLIPLSSWLGVAGAGGRARAVAQKWLSSWGLDLAVVDDDHDLRNLASYRPSEFRLAGGLSAHEIAEFAEQLWQLFEPNPARRFQTLERFLLRKAIARWAPRRPTEADVQGLGLGPAESQTWARFLATPDSSLPLRYAEEDRSIDDPYCHLTVVSRAALLLFVATSVVRELLSTDLYQRANLAFWWSRHGVNRALWQTADARENPLDAWADIQAAIRDSQRWRVDNRPANASLRGWRETQSGAVTGFGAFELVAIWGLVP